MKLVKVLALRDHEWARAWRHEGEVYVVDSEDIRYDALLAIGFAKYVGPVEEVRRPLLSKYKPRDVRAK